MGSGTRREAFRAFVRINAVDIIIFDKVVVDSVQKFIDTQVIDGKCATFDFARNIRHAAVMIMLDYAGHSKYELLDKDVIARCNNISELMIKSHGSEGSNIPLLCPVEDWSSKSRLSSH